MVLGEKREKDVFIHLPEKGTRDIIKELFGNSDDVEINISTCITDIFINGYVDIGSEYYDIETGKCEICKDGEEGIKLIRIPNTILFTPSFGSFERSINSIFSVTTGDMKHLRAVNICLAGGIANKKFILFSNNDELKAVMLHVVVE